MLIMLVPQQSYVAHVNSMRRQSQTCLSWQTILHGCHYDKSHLFWCLVMNFRRMAIIIQAQDICGKGV